MSVNLYQQSELSDVQPVHEGFRVTDISSANWCLRKLQALKAQSREINQLAEAEHERIESWKENQLHDVDKSIDFFEQMLIRWHQEQLEADPRKNKSIKLPYGVLKSTTRKPSPKKIDDNALLQHLKASGYEEFIKVKESPDWAEFKKIVQVVEYGGQLYVLDEDGQRIPGVDVDLGGTKFTVEVDE